MQLNLPDSRRGCEQVGYWRSTNSWVINLRRVKVKRGVWEPAGSRRMNAVDMVNNSCVVGEWAGHRCLFLRLHF